MLELRAAVPHWSIGPVGFGPGEASLRLIHKISIQLSPLVKHRLALSSYAKILLTPPSSQSAHVRESMCHHYGVVYLALLSAWVKGQEALDSLNQPFLGPTSIFVTAES